MMSEEESKQGFRVCSMILMDNYLTWLLADGKQKSIIFRQVKIGK
jgi:hypothetical protein